MNIRFIPPLSRFIVKLLRNKFSFATIISLSFVMLFASIFTPIASASSVIQTGSSVNSNCLQPPQNTDLTTLTDVQLSLYGLPPHPTNKSSSSLGDWQKAMHQAKIHDCQLGTKTNKHASSDCYPSTSQECSLNWSGNIATGWGYSEVNGSWQEPCLTLELQFASSATWVGLGGDGNDGGGNLVQSGTAADEVSAWWGGWTQNHYAWIEDVPDDKNEVQAPFSVDCGNWIYAEDWQDYSGGWPTVAHMFIQNSTTGHYWSAYNTTTFSNGSTAEWITERDSSLPLSNFYNVTISSAEATQSGNYLPVGHLSHNYSVMFNSYGWNYALASPGPISSDGTYFTNHWYASQ